MNRLGVKALVCLAANALFAPLCPALSNTFTGAADSTFTNAANWQNQPAPVSGQDYNLFFQPTPLSDGSYSLLLDSSFDAHGLTFYSGVSKFSLTAQNNALLTVGNGGINTYTNGPSDVRTITLTGLVKLSTNQNWVIGESSDLRLNGLTGPGPFSKGGLGTLTLAGNSDYAGTILIQSGTLSLASNTGQGSGAITFQSNSTLAAGASSVTASNALFLQNSLTLANQLAATQNATLTLSGPVTLTQSNSVINLGTRLLANLSGTLDSPVENSVTVAGPGSLMLSGTVGQNIKSLNFTSGSHSLFTSLAALPATLSVTTGSGSSFGIQGDGTNNNALLAAALARITAPASFAGRVSLDSNGTTKVYSGTLDFSSFTNSGFSLGSDSSATLAADAILKVSADGYRFGGGSGSLNIVTNLQGAYALWADSAASSPSTLFLQGNNTFTGDLHVSHGFLYLDSAGALPNGSTLHLGSSGYVGFTPNWGGTPAGLIARVRTDQAATSVIGFDASVPTGGTITTTEAIDLSGFTNPVYFGTSTSKAIIDQHSTITAPGDGILRLAALHGASLDVQASISSVHGVNALVLGHPDSNLTGTPGTYVLSATNYYTGGTTVLNGATLEVAPDPATPLGSGDLTLNGATLRFGNANSTFRTQGLPNKIVFQGSGNRITGSGVLDAPGGLTIANGNWIAPGYTEAATDGQQHFRALFSNSAITLGPDGGFEVITTNPGGTAGQDYSGVASTQTLTFSSTAAHKFNFKLISYSADGTRGALANLVSGHTYSMVLAIAELGINNFDATTLAVDASQFLTGSTYVTDFSFSIQPFNNAGAQQLILSFTPIPEPETWALMLAGSASLLIPLLRRRRK